MSLTSILVYAVSALTVMSGLAGFVGASKSERKRMVWFFVMTIFAAMWAISCAIFLDLPTTASDTHVHMVMSGIYFASMLMELALFTFCTWKSTWFKILIVPSIVYVAVISTLVLNDQSLMFANYTLANQGNSVELTKGWVYVSYILFYVIDCLACLAAVFQHSRKTRTKRVRQGDLVLLVGLAVTSFFSCVFDLVLPMTDYSLIWVGPLSLSATMITFYFALLKFRIVSLSSNWLKVLSTIVLMVSGVVIYMLVFYLIFTALFKIPNPSPAILVLNFLMIAIVLILMPVISEVYALMRSMISVGQVDIAYVIKKLNHLATRNVDLRELAGFLADHLHFTYIGFVINGHLYGSRSMVVKSEDLAQIKRLKSSPGALWQEPNKSVQKIFDELELKAVAELRNAKGKAFGQILVGKPMGKVSFERRDLLQIEMIINLVATVIDSEKHLRA